jgi:hypothetical protein
VISLHEPDALARESLANASGWYSRNSAKVMPWFFMGISTNGIGLIANERADRPVRLMVYGVTGTIISP